MGDVVSFNFGLYHQVGEAIASAYPPERLRTISYGEVEEIVADLSGQGPEHKQVGKMFRRAWAKAHHPSSQPSTSVVAAVVPAIERAMILRSQDEADRAAEKPGWHPTSDPKGRR